MLQHTQFVQPVHTQATVLTLEHQPASHQHRHKTSQDSDKPLTSCRGALSGGTVKCALLLLLIMHKCKLKTTRWEPTTCCPLKQSGYPVALAVHLYTLTSTKPVAIAINSNTKGKKIAVTPMIARGSCSHKDEVSATPQAVGIPNAACVTDAC